MKHLYQFLISHILFGATLFFAAGAPPVMNDAGGNDAGGADTGDGADVTDAGDGSDSSALEYGADDAAEVVPEEGAEAAAQQTEAKEEPEASEFRGSVSARLRGMVKASPKLAEVFKENPKLQEQIEATFRREAALREVFPTVAEARAMREQFPNGLQDVQQLLTDAAEVEALDKDFYSRDQEGNYPGHAKMLANMFQDDREATVALMRNVPKEWARLDPESYNERMGAILGSTLAHDGVPDFIAELLDAAKVAKNDALASGLSKLLNWTKRFSGEKPRPTADEERLQRERQAFDREKRTRTEEDGQRFHSSFVAQAKKLQTEIISGHVAIKRLEKVPGITPEKRAKIVEEVRGKMEKLLGKSPSFMRKLRPAYESRNLEETVKLQRAAWSQSWLLNKMIREVLRVETPAMVKNNREAAGARRPAGKAAPDKSGSNSNSKGPRQVGGRWYRGDGTPFTTAEVIAGKHLS